MPEDEKIHEEWLRLVREWRSVWGEWNEVMARITLAFSRFENPPNDDLELANQLEEQEDAARARMKEFIQKRVLRRRDRSHT